MRILWYSNAPWAATGYGVQTAIHTRALTDAGHQVAVHANYGLDGGALNWGPVKVYPRGLTELSLDTLAANARDFQADVVVSLFDVWVLRHDLMQANGVRWAPWFPIDSEPISEAVARQVREAWAPLVFSRHAVRMCEQAGIPCRYVPHAFDPEIYAVTQPRRDAREKRKLPTDAFIVGVCAANKGVPSRKAWPEILQAFAELRRRHSDAVLALHTTTSVAHQGVDILACADAFGIPEDAMLVCDQYRQTLGFPGAYMRDFFEAIDVLVNPAQGEGFGVPIMEAQACGTPVIVGDWTAMPELVEWGWKVTRDEAQPWWTPQHAFQFHPSVPAIADRMEAAYQAKAAGAMDDTAQRKRCARKTHAAYAIPNVVRDHWTPVLAELEERIRLETAERPAPEPEVLAA